VILIFISPVIDLPSLKEKGFTRELEVLPGKEKDYMY